MKCEELKAYNVVATADVNPEVVDSLGCTEWTGYDKDEVDDAIDELKAENERLKGESCKLTDGCLRLKQCRREKAILADEIRATKRALWLARANAAKNKVRFFGWSFDCYNTTLLINIDGHKYKMPKQSRMMTCNDWIEIFERVEERCRKKAEDYK